MTTRPPFVDTHVHFNDRAHPTLRWGWLEPGAAHPRIPEPDGYKHVRYVAEELIAETRFTNVTKVVHVQAALDSPDPVDETLWLEPMAARTGLPHGIIAALDLRADDAPTQLARHAEHPRLRGFRDMAVSDHLDDPTITAAMDAIAAADLIAEFSTSPAGQPALRALAERYPDTRIVLEHAGLPASREPDDLTAWRESMTVAAGAPNVTMKVSGLGMTDPRWTPSSVAEVVGACLDAFGADRVLLGTNWPVDRLFSSYPDLVDAYIAAVAELSPDEQHAVLAGNAERVYRI